MIEEGGERLHRPLPVIANRPVRAVQRLGDRHHLGVARMGRPPEQQQVHCPALFRWQGVNRNIEPLPEKRIGENVALEGIPGGSRGLDFGQRRSVAFAIDLTGPVLLAPDLFLRVQAQALDRHIEADLEEVELVPRTTTIGGEHLVEPAKHRVADPLAGQRGATATLLGPGHQPPHALLQNLVKPLKPGVRGFVAALPDEMQDALAGDIAGMGAIPDAGALDQLVARQFGQPD